MDVRFILFQKKVPFCPLVQLSSNYASWLALIDLTQFKGLMIKVRGMGTALLKLLGRHAAESHLKCTLLDKIVLQQFLFLENVKESMSCNKILFQCECLPNVKEVIVDLVTVKIVLFLCLC